MMPVRERIELRNARVILLCFVLAGDCDRRSFVKPGGKALIASTLPPARSSIVPLSLPDFCELKSF
jgi:hypothetical protein